MKTYTMTQRINNPSLPRNAIGWKLPFYEALVDGKPVVSRMIDPNKDSKKMERAFSWGYNGVYPLNLAISILCDLFDISDYALLFEDTGFGEATKFFYDTYIRNNKEPHWKITEDELWKKMSDLLEQIEGGEQ